MSHPALAVLGEDRAVVVIRAEHIPDPVALVESLVAGGIRSIEFTFTTPGVTDIVRTVSAANTGAVIGVGTVLTRDGCRAAVDAGARFLVTPGLRPDVAAEARESGTAMVMGAFTPSEVLMATELGCHAIKIFPAQTVGARYISHLAGPFPDVDFIASGGIDETNAAEFLAGGARAVTAGSSVVTAAAIAAGDWADITRRARLFVDSL